MSDTTMAPIEADILLCTPLQNLLHEPALELPEAEDALRKLETTGSAAEAARYVGACVAWTHRALALTVRGMYEEAFARLTIVRPDYEAGSDPYLEASFRQGMLRVEQKCVQAPFTAWRGLSRTKGVTLAFVCELRELAQELGVKSEPLVPHGLDLEAVRSFLVHSHAIMQPAAVITQLIMYELAEHTREHGGTKTLAEIKNALDLSAADLGRIFGTSRQAVDQWMDRGVPPSRTAEVERVGDVVRYLRKKFKVDRLPQVVRNEVPALGQRSMLQVLIDDGAASLHDYLRAAFSYQLGC